MYSLPRIQSACIRLFAVQFCWICLCSFSARTQGSHHNSIATASPTLSLLIIDSIHIRGNKHTRPPILLRELPFRSGDTCRLSQLVAWFEESKRLLMNTTLFQQVTVFADTFLGDRVQVMIQVRERVNIYPVLFFEPVDRNLNQWLVEQRGSLRRVNYGAQLLLNNTTGRADRTLFTGMGGYTEQLSLSYERPYIDTQLKWGFRVGFFVGRNKEVNLETRNDKQVFMRDPENFIRHTVQAFAEVNLRPRINTRHSFGFQWRAERVMDSVVRRNPTYFPSRATQIRYPRFYYIWNYQRVDNLPYPMQGPLAQVQLARSGIGSSIHLWEVHAKAMMHWLLTPPWSWALSGYVGWKSPRQQPFVNRRFMGYGNLFMSGYEYYVIDGLGGGMARVSLTRELIRHTMLLSYRKGKDPIRIPIRLMARSFAQTGYVYDPDISTGGRLANQFQYSGGLGLDLLIFYDVLFRLEYSVNRFGENGLFLHRKYPF